MTYQFEDFGPFKGLQLFVQVSSLFNKTRRSSAGGGEQRAYSAFGGTNPIWFDALGLAYRIGFRVNF